MLDQLAAELNRELEKESPALAALLSPLGRASAFPPDIPAQAADARGKRYNATIGQITDGQGWALPVPALAEKLETLGVEDLNQALLYSPMAGLPELRRRWRDWQRRDAPEEAVSSLPLVTVGLTHGLSLLADVFAGPGRAVGLGSPFWGNYKQCFGLRTGARMLSAPAYVDGAPRPQAPLDAVAELPAGEPAIVLINAPSNPGGYMPTAEERLALREAALREAERRPLLVVCDDAYAGLVYEDEVPDGSLFWDLVGLHPNLVPAKLDGATKEFSFFGGRVGFLSFGVAPESKAARVLESKLTCLVRATVGSPVATSQVLLLAALRDGEAGFLVRGTRELMARRYQTLKAALAGVDHTLLRPLPCNAGCFALLELGERLEVGADSVRRRLLEQHDTGLVSIGERHLRVAFCSLAEDDIPELVARTERCARELAVSRSA